MADRARKISELTALTTASGDDLLVIVDSPAGSAETKKITLTNLFANVTPNVAFTSSITVSGNTNVSKLNFTNTTNTPASSTDTGALGEVRVDDTYIYVCVATDTWKRSLIESW